MAKKARLKRRAYFVDERSLQALGLSTDAEVVREAIERVAEMEEFWEFMKESRGILEPGSMETP
jgi:hypothetical protein